MSSCRVAIATLAIAVLCAPDRAAAADRLCDASYQNCRTPLLNLIKAETVGIDVAFWMMEDTRYATAIIERWRAGVPVRVIMDTRANASYPHNAPVIKALADARIPMREKTSGGIVHWKTMVFAGQSVVEFSGANFTPHAFVPTTPYVNYIDEAIYITDNPALVNSFKRRFDDVWTTTSGYRNYANGPATPSRIVSPFPTGATSTRCASTNTPLLLLRSLNHHWPFPNATATWLRLTCSSAIRNSQSSERPIPKR